MNLKPQELLFNAEQAEKSGVPVNWKHLAYQVFTGMNNELVGLQNDRAMPSTDDEE